MSGLLKSVKIVYREYFRKALIEEEQSLECLAKTSSEEIYIRGRIDMLEEVMRVFTPVEEEVSDE